jgi:hypothetical protein
MFLREWCGDHAEADLLGSPVHQREAVDALVSSLNVVDELETLLPALREVG